MADELLQKPCRLAATALHCDGFGSPIPITETSRLPLRSALKGRGEAETVVLQPNKILPSWHLVESDEV